MHSHNRLPIGIVYIYALNVDNAYLQNDRAGRQLQELSTSSTSVIMGN